MTPFPLEHYGADAIDVAPRLLNAILVVGACQGRIVEVEAYMPNDPASHSFRGRTRRNASMFGPPGHLYVYLVYGMHFCANVVTGPDGSGQAVLLRAVTPLAGLDLMRSRRGPVPDRSLTDGPGKLCQAFGIDRRFDGAPLRGPDVLVLDDPSHPAIVGAPTTRIGISTGHERLWRWRIQRVVQTTAASLVDRDSGDTSAATGTWLGMS